MTYDGELLARARAKLEKTRQRNINEHASRIAAAYAISPQIAECDTLMRTQMTELVRLTVAREPDLNEKLERLREENLDTQRRRAELIGKLGRGEDWLDEIYDCEKCRDTGVYNGRVCSCLERLYNAEMTAELGVLMKNGGESFDSFDLTLYDDAPLPGSAAVPRDTMKKVLGIARAFAENFPEGPQNLLLQGGTGLGKTYLSACVARTVAQKGFSVCYDTASAAVGSFETQKFSRSDEADARVRRMLNCDLMILDDLGTEMPTPMAESALYTLINTRLCDGKKTVVSTNLSYEEIEKRYNAQIYSRIRGEYLRLPFVGRDIRLMKR